MQKLIVAFFTKYFSSEITTVKKLYDDFFNSFETEYGKVRSETTLLVKKTEDAFVTIRSKVATDDAATLAELKKLEDDLKYAISDSGARITGVIDTVRTKVTTFINAIKAAFKAFKL